MPLFAVEEIARPEAQERLQAAVLQSGVLTTELRRTVGGACLAGLARQSQRARHRPIAQGLLGMLSLRALPARSTLRAPEIEFDGSEPPIWRFLGRLVSCIPSWGACTRIGSTPDGGSIGWRFDSGREPMGAKCRGSENRRHSFATGERRPDPVF